jgi:serine/threonine-protein kinase RIO1
MTTEAINKIVLEVYTADKIIIELEALRKDIEHMMSYYITENGISLKSENAIFRCIDKRIAVLRGEKKDESTN